MTFRNKSVSVSRLLKFEACPAAFKFEYIDGIKSEDVGDALPYGKLSHGALEATLRWVVAEEYSGKYPVHQAELALRSEWTKYPTLPESCYTECLRMLRAYAAMRGNIHWGNILGIEHPIEDMDMGDGVKLRGAMDLVFRHGEDVIVEDYKTNRVMFSAEDIESSLQATAYLYVARRLWPGARSYRFVFTMLRHDGGRPLWTTRTSQQLDDFPAHIVASTRRTEAGEYPAKTGPHCRYCSHASRCDKYQKLLSEPAGVRWPMPESLSIEEIAQHRWEANSRASSFYRKRGQYDEALMLELKRRGPFKAGVYSVKMDAKKKDIDYPESRTLELLSEATGLPRDAVMFRVSSMDARKVERLADSVPDPTRRAVLRAQLMAVKRERVVEERIDVTKTKS